MCPPAKVMTNKARIRGVGTRIEEIPQQGNDSSAEMSRTEVTIHFILSRSTSSILVNSSWAAIKLIL